MPEDNNPDEKFVASARSKQPVFSPDDTLTKETEPFSKAEQVIVDGNLEQNQEVILHKRANSNNVDRQLLEPAVDDEDVDDDYDQSDRVSKKSRRGIGFSIFTPFKLIWKLLTTVRNIVNWGCFSLIVIIIILIITVVFKPDITWKPLKNFMNKSVSPTAEEGQTLEKVYTNINQQLSKGKTVKLTEGQLAVLVGDKVGKNETLRTDVANKDLKIYINIDKADAPLWIVVNLNETADSKVRLNSIGFERVHLPQGLTRKLGERIGNLLDFIKRDDMAALADELLDDTKINKKDLTVDSAMFKDDMLVIEFR